VDGRDALSNEAPAESRYRDGPARARLQSYARHEYRGYLAEIATLVSRDESVETTRIGDTVGALYTLDDSFELVPGIWTFELWDGDRKLLTQSFTLEKR
jgi:hypothetical protein